MAAALTSGGMDLFSQLPNFPKNSARIEIQSRDRTFSILENEDGSIPAVLEFSEKVAMSKAAEVNEVSEKEGPWVQFLKSPHFTVIATGVVAVAAGIGMYCKLDSKIEALRMETKSDLQVMSQHADARFDKVDARFDKIDAKFDSVLSKMDADSKEMRALIQSEKR